MEFGPDIQISKEEYKERRQKLINMLVDGPIVLVGNVQRNRINDTYYEFRQESNFLYLSGFNEPDAYMILSKTPFEVNGKMVNEVLFVPENSLRSMTWDGKKLGVKGAKEKSGFEAVLPTFTDHDNSRKTPKINNFETFLTALGLAHHNFHVNTPILHTHTFQSSSKESYWDKFTTDMKESLEKAYTSSLKDTRKTKSIQEENPITIYDKSRLWMALKSLRDIKSETEKKLLQRAIDITNVGHFEAFKMSKHVDNEYQVEAALEYAFKFNGAEDVGYNSIVGCGMNGTILHYNTNREKYKHNEMFVVDAGAEYHGYTADITRSFPAGGTFSKEQKEIYQIVLDAQNAGAKEFLAGKTYRDVSHAIDNVRIKGLLNLGLIKENPSISDAKKQKEHLWKQMRQLTLHGWGHPIGLDVHDPSRYFDETFKEGMIWTIEPGIYISDRTTLDIPEKYLGIGVRIEDMYLITSDGNVHMSKKLPREISEIETVMKERSGLLLR